MQFTGCDTVSSFSSHGKRTALKLLLENKKSQDAFARVGQQWTVPLFGEVCSCSKPHIRA